MKNESKRDNRYMFTDELIEDLLINEKMMYMDAFLEVCKEKLVGEDLDFTGVRRIEHAYQCVCKRHPHLNTAAFRNYVCFRSERLGKALGWVITCSNNKEKE